MYNFRQLSWYLLLIILFAACSKPLPALEGVDLELWKSDRNACHGERAKMMEAIVSQKEKLKTLSEMDLVGLLGRPDENQLLDRNQKFYKYYLEPGPPCDHSVIEPKMLILRINAMGLTKETLVK
ncbi:MAG TPA: hypothetical protein VIS49_10625 [Cyclobacteriaceae bacterium]